MSLLGQLSRSFFALALLATLVAPFATLSAHAQRAGDFALTYTQSRSKFSGAPEEYFYLRGATAELAYNVWKNVGIGGSASGVAATNLRGSIDIEQLAFLVGPRYTWNVGRIDPVVDTRRGGIFVEGKVGYTFAFSGLYPVGNTLADHASALTYQAGGGLNLNIYHRFDLRLIEADYVRTQLPNGGNNQQNTLRLATGINFHLGR